MNKKNYVFTSESVSEGHPDKVADQISDAILDAYLEQDSNAKVACECLITTGRLFIAGEVSSNAQVAVIDIAKKVIRQIGYTNILFGFDPDIAEFINLLHQQSPEINKSVKDGGAGDQGLMFGYACDETPELMPLPITISHELMEAQSKLRKLGEFDWLLPDAKSQVSIRYSNGIPVSIEKIVFSTQHKEWISQEQIRKEVIERIIQPIITNYLPGSNPEILVNPSGSFTIGGPHGDTGLTGRKIIVDTYGGSCAHGGGAFSGKDPSKVDRSAAYAARFVAKHIVAAGLAKRCTVQISYAIGVAEPTSIYIDSHNTGIISDEAITEKVQENFNLTPNGIIETLQLKRPIYFRTAAYGHFGKHFLPWEQINPTIINNLNK